jgi:hypothetical protein
MQLPKKLQLAKVTPAGEDGQYKKYRKTKIPSRGTAFEAGEQISL